MPVVSVGIPFYNEERFLEQAVRSVLAQTLDDLEVILVDDGSSDRSLEIARSFTDPRVVVVPPDGRRRFLAARLNQITRAARAGLVARMDGDDIAHPDRLARQVAILSEDAKCDAVGTWIALVGEDEQPFAVTETAQVPPTLEIALSRGLLSHATLVGRRAWLEANPYNERLTRVEDRDLWCRTVSTSRFRIVPSPLYVVRIHACEPGFLEDYLEAQRQNRQLIVRYGAQAMGARRAAVHWAASHGKSAVMRMAVHAGLAPRLVRRRGRAPTADERAMIDEALLAGRGTGA